MEKTDLPFNIDAERAVLAGCLNNETVLTDAMLKLKPTSFYRSGHQLIFEQMQRLSAKETTVDVLTVADALNAVGKLDLAGGQDYLMDLQRSYIDTVTDPEHIEIVSRLATYRDLTHASAYIRSLAMECSDDVDSIIAEAEKAVMSVTEQRIGSNFQKLDELLNQALEELSAACESGSNIIGVPTGFIDVDELFGGFRPGDLIVLGARPAVGKTAFALNIALNAAKANCVVAFLSLEMPAVSLTQRLLAAEARVGLSSVRQGNFTGHDWQSLTQAFGDIFDLPLFIDDTSGLSILELRTKAKRELHRELNGRKGLIIVDYLQLMQPAANRRDSSRANDIAEISRGLKILAKEMEMPVLALSQVSREVEKRTNKRPMLSDLRESGAIEQDADIVMFLDRSVDEMEAEHEDRPDLGTATLIVAKHRNGRIGDIPLSFQAESTRFGNIAREAQY